MSLSSNIMQKNVAIKYFYTLLFSSIRAELPILNTILNLAMMLFIR
jgi:hypothetical protein